jgi:hypothetical protein
MKTYTILVLAGCTLAASLNAQTAKKGQTAAKDTLIQRDLVLEKEYEPAVGPAEKLLVSPDLETINIDKQPLSFSITESPTTIVGDYNPLPAAGIQITYPSSDQFGYIRLGIGSHRSFLGDAQFNLVRQSLQSLDISFQHRSVFGDITNSNDEAIRSYSNKNNFIASYKLHQENTEIEASLSEKYSTWNYYGTWEIDPVQSTLSVPSGQWSSDSKFRFGIRSKNIGLPFSWIINAEGHLFRLGRGIDASTLTSDEKGGREKEFSIKALLNYDQSYLFHFGIEAYMRNFTYRSPISQPVDEAVSLNQMDKNFEGRRWFEFSPYAKMTYKKWTLTGGLKMAIPTLESERVKLNITASASTPLGDKMIFNAKLDGGVQPLSYREGLEMNPYLDPSIRLKSSWKVIDLSGQIDYRPVNNLRLTPVVGYDVTKDMPFFYNGYLEPEGVNEVYGNVFDVKYMTSNRFRIGLNGLYSYRSFLTILGEINYNQYLNFSSNNAVNALLKANDRKAWYKPGFEMHLRADITPIDVLTLYFDYNIEAQRYAADNTSFCKKLDDIKDLNLGANYKLTNDVGIFLQLNNLLDQRYEVWNAYPVHGFTAVVGGTVKF